MPYSVTISLLDFSSGVADIRAAAGRSRSISLYERLSPPLARSIGRSTARRAAVRRLIVAPAAGIARRMLVRDERRAR
jgi:hypothetical protein